MSERHVESDPRWSPPCRKALLILATGPLYLTGASRYFGSRRGQPLVEGRVRHRQKVLKPLVHVDIAGRLTRAGMARITHTGRPDRRVTYMLVLTELGRAAIALMTAPKAPYKAPPRRDDAAPADAP